MVRESLVANEKVDVLRGSRMTVCTNSETAHERVADSNSCELLGGYAEGIENTRRNNAIEQ